MYTTTLPAAPAATVRVEIDDENRQAGQSQRGLAANMADQYMCWPPLMAMLAPVRKAASSEAR